MGVLAPTVGFFAIGVESAMSNSDREFGRGEGGWVIGGVSPAFSQFTLTSARRGIAVETIS